MRLCLYKDHVCPPIKITVEVIVGAASKGALFNETRGNYLR